MSSSDASEAAVELARAGHPVFPCWGVRSDRSCHCPQGANCDRPGKHPLGRLVPNGLHDASDDEEKVAGWWRQYPTANVAIATGRTLIAIDCDRSADVDGTAVFLRLAEERGGIPSTAGVTTGGGGAHFYFAADDDVEVRNQQEILIDGRHTRGIDVRGEGGYVIVPPSTHVSGSRYAWALGIEHLAPAPPWLLQILAGGGAPVVRAAAGPSIVRDVDPATLERIKSALEVIPPNLGRGEWVEDVSMPLHDAFGGSETGFELWHEWCSKGAGLVTPNGNPAYGGDQECRRVWRSFSTRRRNPKGILTLWACARRYGWTSTENGVAELPFVAPTSAEPDAEEIKASRAGPENPGPFPVSVVHGLDGPIAQAVEWVLRCSRRPDEVIAFAAVLGTFAGALGRRFEGPAGTRCSIALAVLAPSGSGKDRPLECLKNVLTSRPNLLHGLLDDTPTHRAQLDEVLMRSAGQLIMALDEYGSVLSRWLTDTSSVSMSPTVRRLAGHGMSVYRLAPVSPRHPARAANPAAWDAGIYAPSMSLVGFATPGQFYESLSEASLIDGLLGRHVVLATDSAHELCDPTASSLDPPDSLREWLDSVEGCPIPTILLPIGPPPQVIDGQPPAPQHAYPISFAGDAVQGLWADLSRDLDRAALQSIAEGDEVTTAILRRLPGQVATIALVLALGESLPVWEATIQERHLRTAYRVARWSADHLSWKLRHGVAADPFAHAYARICEAIERADGKRVYQSLLGRKLWAAPHIARAWKLVVKDPRFEACEKWACWRRTEPGSDAIPLKGRALEG